MTKDQWKEFRDSSNKEEQEEVPNVDEDNEQDAKPLPDILNAADFLMEPYPTPEELVEGLIHKGTLAMLAGNSKTYKSFVLIDLGVSVATGADWWGRKTAKGKVLYANFEIDTPFFQRRLSQIAQHKDIDQPLTDFHVWNLRRHAVDLSVLAPKIIERCKNEDYALIIIDPIYKLLGDRNENAAGDVADFLNELDSIATETGASVAVCHHYAKGSAAGKEQLDRASGSGVFARYPDAIITLTAHQVEDSFVAEATLRNFKPVKPFVLTWAYPVMVLAEHLDPAKLKQKVGRPASYDTTDLLGCLQDGMTAGEWKKSAETIMGIGKTTFYKLMNQCKSTGRIRCEPSGNTERWFKTGTVTVTADFTQPAAA
jgi:hypothetical protein